MKYRQYGPPQALREAIECVWTLEGRAADLDAELQPVLPDGRSELIVHFGDPFERIDSGGAPSRQAGILFAGQLTGQLVLRPTGRIAVAGVRFRPDGAAGLLEIPQADLAGLTAPVQDLSAALFAALSEVTGETDCPGRGLALLTDRLAPRMAGRPPDVRVRRVVDALVASHGCVRVDDLAGQAGMTRRHLERRFLTVVGVTPKRLARIARFQHALSRLERMEVRGRGARTAAECGYADQAHFIRDFRELAGCPPGAHLIGRGELTGFFTPGRLTVPARSVRQ